MAAVAAPVSVAWRMPRWLSSEHPFPWLLPAAALMVVFGIFPLYKAFESSLYKKNAATRKLVFDPRLQLGEGGVR